MRYPYSLRRLNLLRQGVRVDRDRPDLTRLSSITDPEQFCWEILPHAARSFAVSIALLPEPDAKAAAVAYLYARMLDSYEDLHPDPEAGREALDLFATRFSTEAVTDPPTLPADLVRDNRDRAHLLLLERCVQVDQVYRELPESHRAHIARLVQRMAAGMKWASATFEEQDGCLTNDSQLQRYCHIVIGEPTQFVLRLVAGRSLSSSETSDALAVSEFVQLANVTRDIERDLDRGVAYHPVLKPYLGGTTSVDRTAAVRVARIDMTLLALKGSTAFRRLAASMALPAISSERAASVAMFRFTEAHYQGQAALIRSGTPRPSTKGAVRSTGSKRGM